MGEARSCPELSIVVSTIGRPESMRRFIDSLRGQANPNSFELIVVDQSEDQESARVASTADLPFHVVTTTSSRGACKGRNTGTALARGAVLAFPDDNCGYTETTVADVLKTLEVRPDVGILSGLLVTDRGTPSMLRWPESRTQITRKNVQQTAIEATMFVRRELFVSIGGFDESIGVGSAGPFQAGEATDLILRCLESGASGVFDPAIHVVHEDFRDAVDPNFTAKMRGYGRGLGHVYRTNHLPASEVAYYAGRKLAAAAVRSVRGRTDLARADLAWARGMVEGYLKSGNSHRQIRRPSELECRDG